VKHTAKIVLLISFMFLSLVVRADSDVEKFVQFKISSLQLVSSFSSYIYFEGDNRNKARLNQAKALGDQALLNLTVPNPELSLKWQQISDYLESSQKLEFDVNLEAGWSILQGELSQIIAIYESTLPSLKDTPGTGHKVSEMQVKMETILSRYMAFANSTMGGYGITSNGTPLKEQIKTVTKDIAQLAEGNEKYQPLARKWKYIEKTLLAYNSNVAPFVVMHTYVKMRELISAY